MQRCHTIGLFLLFYYCIVYDYIVLELFMRKKNSSHESVADRRLENECRDSRQLLKFVQNKIILLFCDLSNSYSIFNPFNSFTLRSSRRGHTSCLPWLY